MSAQTPIEDTSLETFQNVINVNLVGTFLCTREAVRIFKAQTPQGGTCALQHLCSPRSHADDRENHQQRIDLRIHAAPALVPLHFVEARSAGHDQVHRARRKRIQHHLHAGRHWRVIHLNYDRAYDSHTHGLFTRWRPHDHVAAATRRASTGRPPHSGGGLRRKARRRDDRAYCKSSPRRHSTDV